MNYDANRAGESDMMHVDSLAQRVSVHHHVVFARLVPVWIGWSNTGKRLFVIGLKKDTLIWLGPNSEEGVQKDF